MRIRCKTCGYETGQSAPPSCLGYLGRVALLVALLYAFWPQASQSQALTPHVWLVSVVGAILFYVCSVWFLETIRPDWYRKHRYRKMVCPQCRRSDWEEKPFWGFGL